VAVGVAQVDRLADGVVGEAADGGVDGHVMLEGVAQIGPRRQQQGEVVQPRCPPHRRQAGLAVEQQQRRVARAHLRRVAIAR